MSSSISRTRLRIGLPLVSWHLLPMLTDLQAAHPELDLELIFDNRKVDLIAEHFDAAVRTGDVDDPRLAVHDLGSFRLYIVASKEYLQRKGRPTAIADLPKHDCILYEMPHNGQMQHWPLHPEAGTALELPARVTCNNDAARLHFALHGLGLTCMSEFSVQEHLDAGRLEAVLEPETRYRYTFRLVWPHKDISPPGLQTLLDFVIRYWSGRSGVSSPQTS